MAKAAKKEPEFGSTFPFGLDDMTGSLLPGIVACEESFHAVRVVYKSAQLWRGVEVCDMTIERDYITIDKDKRQRDGFIYGPPCCANPGPVTQTWLANLRIAALEHGATPEAIRLIGLHMPWTKKEEAILAEKLKAKAGGTKKAAAADAGAKTGTAKKTTGGKGNPEALKKAREAKAAAGPDTRKITILNKENPYREGSGRAASFDALKGAKTVEDYQKAGGKTKYLSRWEAEKRIKLG